MIKITKKLIKYNFTTNANSPKYIVIHDTGNRKKGANAEMHYQYFNGGDKQASAHFFTDDKGILQLIEVKDKAWHVGKGKNGITNSNTIGIEVCVNEEGDYVKAVEFAVKLTVQLMKEYNIPLKNVVRHHDCSSWGKVCPMSMSANNWAEWHKFKARVENLQAPVVETWKVNPLKELCDIGLVQDFEGWKKKLDSPAPNWLVFLLINAIRKEGCNTEDVLKVITERLNG